jgi:hypothetical protein
VLFTRAVIRRGGSETAGGAGRPGVDRRSDEMPRNTVLNYGEVAQMRRAWRGLIPRLLVTVLVSLMAFAAASPFMATPALGATSTNFSPAPTVTLPAGTTTTVTIVGTGLAAGDTAAQFDIRHNTTSTVISNPQCVGIFAGANPNQATTAGQGDLLACTFSAGGASGQTGNVMTVTLTANAADTLTFNAATTFYLTAAFATDPAGTLNTLQVIIGAAPTITPTPTVPGPTFTFTATATTTGIATLTPTVTTTRTVTATATNTAVAVTNTPTPTPTPAPGNGTLVVCKALTVVSTAAGTFNFTTPPGGPAIPSITVPAGSIGPVCAAGVSAFAGSVAVTEATTTGFTLSSATGGTLSGNTVTATITAGLTTTITFTNAPNTGTLIVCKQLVFAGLGGLGSTGGIGGIGGVGGIGGIGGIGGLGPLSQVSNTFTWTTPAGGPTIPSVTIPAGQLGPICGAGVTVAAGTVAVTEVVPIGFTLTSVTGGTLSGQTATATITSGQTTTLTFINDPGVVIIQAPPLLPPPPLQFLPAPPPPLLPPPMAPPMAAAAAAPGVPIIPESDSVTLLAIGLAAIGGFAVLRRRYRQS